MNLLARTRLVNALLALFAMLAVATVVWTSGAPTASDVTVRARHLLPVFRPDEVTRIEVSRLSHRAVLVKQATPPRAAGASPDEPAADLQDEAPGVASAHELLGLPQSEWVLSEPVETDADSEPVERLLGSLRYATWEREVTGAEVAALSAPEAVLGAPTLAIDMGRTSYRLRLGPDSVAPQGSKYVEVVQDGGEPRAYVIKKKLAAELFVDVDSFRGRQIAPYRKGSVDRVVLSSAAGVRRLRRVGHDFHFDQMNEDQRAERVAVDRIFMALARATLEPFVDYEVAKSAVPSEANVRVSLVPTGEQRPEASLEFGGDCPGHAEKTIALRHLPEPLAGCVDKSVLSALREPADVLVDRGLFALNADEVDHVRIEEPDHVLDFAREGDGFVLREPLRAELDPEAGAERLARILDVQGDLLVGRDKPPMPTSFAAVITLESSSRLGAESVKETVKLGPPLADGRRRVFRDADGAVLLISAEAALALRADSTLLKKQQIFDYPANQVRRVAVRAGAVKQTLERGASGGLTLVEPKGYAVDGGLAIELIDQLRGLRALSWVTDRPSKGFGLDKPRAEVTLTVEVDGNPVERTVRIGGNATGGHYASVDSDPGVFITSRALLRSATTWLLDRSGFYAERDSIVEITINGQERGAIALRRVAGQLTPQKGSRNFDPSRIEELVSALETLRPEAAVHTGPALPGEGFRRPLLSVTIKRQSPDNVGAPPIRFTVGTRDSFQDAAIYYARQASVNATFALPREQVQRLLDLF